MTLGERCVPLTAERDVRLRRMMRPSGMMCAVPRGPRRIANSDSWGLGRRVSGTHHIILRQSRKTSLFAKRTASLARRANITFSGRLAHKRPACTDMRQKPTEVRKDPYLSRLFINCPLGHLAKACFFRRCVPPEITLLCFTM